MVKAMFTLLLLWMTTSFADVDANFSSGALGVKWGANLEQVQAMYPGGTSWSNGPEKSEGEVAYAVSGTFKVLAIDVPVTMVHFIFSKSNTLDRVFFHFNYSDREAALYGAALALGQEYSIRDEAHAREFLWKPGKGSYAKMEIGHGPQFPWSFLAVRCIREKSDSGKQ